MISESRLRNELINSTILERAGTKSEPSVVDCSEVSVITSPEPVVASSNLVTVLGTPYLEACAGAEVESVVALSTVSTTGSDGPVTDGHTPPLFSFQKYGFLLKARPKQMVFPGGDITCPKCGLPGQEKFRRKKKNRGFPSALNWYFEVDHYKTFRRKGRKGLHVHY